MDDLMKMEPDSDPLAVQTSDNADTEERKLLSEEGNLLDFHPTEIKTECIDRRYDMKSEMTYQEAAVAVVGLPIVKNEAEENSCELDEMNEEGKPEVTGEENEDLTESIMTFAAKHCSNAMDSGKRKRNVLTLKQKLELLNEMDKGVSRTKLMEQYHVGSSTLYDIKKQAKLLRQFVMKSESSKAVESRKTLHQSRCDDLDRVLYDWFSLKRSEGACVSGPMLQNKAKELHQKMKIPGECAFSVGWLNRFKQRHGIRKLGISSERQSGDDVSANEFIVMFQKLIQENNITAEQIYNADETGLFWRYLPTTTLACGSETSPKGFKRNNDRVTILLCANAAGTHKVKPTVVGKFRNPRCFGSLTTIPLDYRSQKNALMDANVFQAWFREVFVPSVKTHFCEKGLPPETKAYLLLDSCRAHPPAEDLGCHNVEVLFLPPSVTSLIQPMDQGVIQNFKMNYRAHFMRKCVNHERTAQDFQKTYTLKDTLFLTTMAWNEVKSITLQHSWSKVWPAVMFENDEEEDFRGFDSRLERSGVNEIVDVLHYNNMPLTEEESSEWIEVDSTIPVTPSIEDDEIIEHVIGKGKEEEDEDDPVSTARVSWQEADAGLSTFIRFAEQSSYMSAHDVVQLHCIYSEFVKHRRLACKQADIGDDMLKKFKSSSAT
ncbi:jerky protein homolog [Periplaneta americana]|uniref:jerky protein homolog n=1 Tax=Periplaneta americana TaxID=6978 RepID=UPI0037E832CC